MQEVLTEKFKALSELEMQKTPELGWLDYMSVGMGGGGNVIAEGQRQTDMLSLQDEIDILGKRMAMEQMKQVNPEAEKQDALSESISKEMVTVDFKNVPIGTQITGGGGAAGFSMPSTSATR
jgi:hypothetical protein